MVQMKVSAAVLVAAAAVAPALAQNYYSEDGLVARENIDELNDILAREYGYDIDDLYERDPMFGYHHIKKFFGGHRHGGEGHMHHHHHGMGGGMGGGQGMQGGSDSAPPSPAPDATAREYDDSYEFEARDFDDSDLYEREPMFGYHHIKKFFGGHRHGGGEGHMHHHHGGMGGQGFQSGSSDSAPPSPAPDATAREYDDSLEFEARDFDDSFDLYERDPMFGYHHIKKFFGGHRHGGGEGHMHMHHHHGMGGGMGGGQGMQGGSDAAPPSPAPDATAREYDESLEARDVQPEYEELLTRYFDDLYERELAAESEYTELAARAPEPGIIEWFKNLFHPHKKSDDKKKKDEAAKKAAADKAAADKAAAKPKDDDSTDVDSREFDDFYDLD